MAKKNFNWYNTSVIYEIYLESFSEEGFQGIIRKLDYIKQLGVQAIWLCPIFGSPFIDSGYDISDYYKVNKRFGSMSDFEELVDKAHKRGLKIILDIALSHTSHEHPWFKEACQSKDSSYRDYYICKEGKEGKYPNNWISSKTFKPTWTYNKATNHYYLHIYTKYQPDLNWRNDKVREEIYKILEFWIDKSIDGFRLDVVNKIAKPNDIENIESKKAYADYLYENHSKSHEFIKEMRREVFDKHEGVLMMGQTSGVNIDQGILYGNEDEGELDLFLQFDHMDVNARNKPLFHQSVMKWQNIDDFGAWPTVFFASHDSARMVSRLATSQEEYIDVAAKMLCVMQLCLKGTQVIYMGDELALFNAKKSRIDQFVDIRSKDIYHAKKKQGKQEEQIISELNEITRDNARMQIPWDRADKMLQDEGSVLSFYQKIIAWRKNQKTVLYGATVSLLDDDENIFAYQRILDDTTITVLANMSVKQLDLDCKVYGKEIISNYQDSQHNKLLPFEAKIIKK